MGEGVTITKDAYVELINADFEALDKYMPEHSLEKQHIKKVLQWSVEKEFPAEYWDKKKTCPDCKGEGYMFFVDQGEPAEEYKCMTCKELAIPSGAPVIHPLWFTPVVQGVVSHLWECEDEDGKHMRSAAVRYLKEEAEKAGEKIFISDAVDLIKSVL